MQISDIQKLAALARVDIPEEEMAQFAKSFDSSLGFVDQIQSVSADVGGRDLGTVHNIMREDADPNAGGECTEALLAAAPATKDGYIKVKKIL